MVTHLGIACYDKFKNIIVPVQVKVLLYRLVEKMIVPFSTEEWKAIA